MLVKCNKTALLSSENNKYRHTYIQKGRWEQTDKNKKTEEKLEHYTKLQTNIQNERANDLKKMLH